MDTLVAVDNMHTAVVNANDEASARMMEAYAIVADIESDILTVNDALKNVGLSLDQITAEERESIEADAESVISMVADSGELALKASLEAEEVYRASRQVAEKRHTLITAESDKKRVEQALRAAQQSAEDKDEKCTECAALEGELESIRKARKATLQETADISKRSGEHNWNAGNHRDKVLEYRSKVAHGKQKLISKIDEIKRRVINVDI
ncbi:hypothetical protein FGB62_219g09 [Gracilaria domingensis]|nr:hypothetical protein FGB62_219g09 [Gracilaria domingensis]